MITGRDIVLRVVAERRSFDTAVAEVMTTDIEICREDDDLAKAARLMGEKQIRRLVVLDDEGELAGILSLRREHGPRAKPSKRSPKIRPRRTDQVASDAG